MRFVAAISFAHRCRRYRFSPWLRCQETRSSSRGEEFPQATRLPPSELLMVRIVAPSVRSGRFGMPSLFWPHAYRGIHLLRPPLPAISFLPLAALPRNSILVPRRRVPTSDAAATLGTTHGPNCCAECSLWTFWNALAVLAGCALWQPSILQKPL